jgi:hypothetical protein
MFQAMLTSEVKICIVAVPIGSDRPAGVRPGGLRATETRGQHAPDLAGELLGQRSGVDERTLQVEEKTADGHGSP